MKTIRLFIARHGNTFESGDTPVMVGLKSDLPLTQKGHCQAQALADFFCEQNIQFKDYFCGTLSRQKQTLQTVMKAIPGPMLDIPALNEIDYGPWEGQTPQQAEKDYETEFQAWHLRGQWQDALFNEMFAKRLNGLRLWLEHVLKKNQDGDCVFAVSSNGIIRLLLYFMPDLWTLITQNEQFQSYKVKTGHYCELLLSEDGIKVAQWNASPVKEEAALS